MVEILKAKNPPRSGRGMLRQLMQAGKISYGILFAGLGIGGALLALPYVARVPFVGGLVTNAFEFFRPGSVGDGFSQ